MSEIRETEKGPSQFYLWPNMEKRGGWAIFPEYNIK